jgi:isomerase DpgB
MYPSLSPRALCFTIGGGDSLSSSLVTEIKNICDSAEAEADNSFLWLHVRGAAEPTGVPRWPGEEHQIDPHLVSQWEQLLRRVELLRKITITTVEGICGGLALEILLATDFRLICKGSQIRLDGRLGSVWPGMVLHRLANQIGIARARKVALFGGALSDIFACETGIVDEIVEDFATRVKEFVESNKQISPTDVAVRRGLLLEATSTSFESALGLHLASCDRQIRNVRKLKREKARD